MQVINTQDVQSLLDQLKGLNAPTIIVGVAILVVGLIAVRLLLRMVKKVLARSRIPTSLHSFIRTALRILLDIIVLLIAASSMGIPVTSFVALLSIAGLAVTLALQNLLSNLAGGVVLLIRKPFQMGDFIEADSVSGTVEEITMLHTRIRTLDRRAVFLPNASLQTSRVVNCSTFPIRRVDIKVSASYDAHPSDVRRAALHAAGTVPQILDDPPVEVHVVSYGDSAIEYVIFAFCVPSDYLTVLYSLTEQLYDSFKVCGVEMTYPHLRVHMEPGKDHPSLIHD